MIISPPFLPIRAAGQSEESWLNEAMRPTASRLPDTHAAEGSFPLSHNLCWHNGIHLQAPIDDGGNLPVRAIADGIVRFAHQPATANISVDDPQNYNPFQRAGAEPAPAWTDNGCVIIEHTTSIGATGTAETQVTFYSLYMHLNELGRRTVPGQTNRPYWAAGDRILRKDVVGQAGRIYGHGGQVHFEICCDRVNLQSLIGRIPAWSEPVAADVSPAPVRAGRTDCVFGSLFVYLPASTPIDRGVIQPTTALRAPASTVLGTPLWVRMTYDGGHCRCESYDVRGRLLGAAAPEQDAEYRLSLHAAQRHNAVPISGRADTSSPSGWYELLRFGRNLGRSDAAADKDLLPANCSHWRRIVDSNGIAVWTDLNAEGSLHFSEADFLPAMGWNFIDDDLRPTDQHCDSDHLINMIRDPNSANVHRMEPSQLAARLGDSSVQSALKRVICRFPSEWNKVNIAERHKFVKELDSFKGNDIAWSRFEAHLLSLSLDALPVPYLQADWHWHPHEFIATFTRCGWLSSDEFAQIYKTTSQTTRTTYLGALNIVTRKYLYASNPLRLSHFLGQGAVESNSLRTMQEASMTGHLQGTDFYGVAINASSLRNESELGHWYGAIPTEDDPWFRSTKYNSRRVRIASSYNWRNGNLGDPDAQKFRGRGFKQLTGRLNYSKYWVFRGWLDPRSFDDSWWLDPHYTSRDAARMRRRPAIVDDPQSSTETPYNCIDTGGWFLGSERPDTLRQIDRDSRTIAVTATQKSAEQAISYAVTQAINGGSIQQDDRLRQTRAAKDVLL